MYVGKEVRCQKDTRTDNKKSFEATGNGEEKIGIKSFTQPWP